MARLASADPTTVTLYPAIGGSMRNCLYGPQVARTQVHVAEFPVRLHLNTSAPYRQSLDFDLSSSFLSLDATNDVGNPRDAAATLAQHLPGRVAERANFPIQDISVQPRLSRPQSAYLSGLLAVLLSALSTSADGSVPCLDGPEKFRRSSKGHMYDSSSGSSAANDDMTNNGFMASSSPVSKRLLAIVSKAPAASACGMGGRFGGSDDSSNAMTTAHQQAALAGLGMGLPTLGMPNGFNMAQLAQLDGISMRPFGANMNVLSAMGISREAQLLAALVACARGRFGQSRLGSVAEVDRPVGRRHLRRPGSVRSTLVVM
ncbi:hypothetical protein EI94DRAFT_1707823 [Lactarius quietus]|nr:hypothetical protein EI94DRAFT_1707823 [Lactarius quietus]